MFICCCSYYILQHQAWRVVVTMEKPEFTTKSKLTVKELKLTVANKTTLISIGVSTLSLTQQRWGVGCCDVINHDGGA